MDFLELLQQIGFEDAELVAETGFNSSPKTKGVLIRAEKRGNAFVMENKENLLDQWNKLMKLKTESCC